MGVRGFQAAVAGAGAVLILGAGLVSWSNESRDLARERLRATVVAIEARQQPWPGRRAALWGETTQGSAFDHYAQAAQMQGFLRVWWCSKRRQVVEDGQLVTAERLVELRRGWAPALRRLQIGAHCDDVRQPAGGPGLVVGLHQGLKIEVPALFAEGRAEAAVRLWLDGLTFAVDLLGPMGWQEQGVRWLLEVGTPEVIGQLADRELALLAEGLSRLDPLLARWPSYEMAIAQRARGLLDRTDDGLFLGYNVHAWRHGFDLELQQVETLEELLELGRLLQPVAEDGGQRQAQWRAWSAAPRGEVNWYGRWLEPLLVAQETQQRQVLAQLRLLRLAVAFHRGGPLPELADPFTSGPLQVEIDGQTAAFRSTESVPWLERSATRR